MAPPDRQRRQADWSRYVPPAQRHQILLRRFIMRSRSLLLRRSTRILMAVLFYLAICLGLVVWGGASLGMIGLLPLVLAPAIGYLAYWLVWNEFHR